MVTGTPAPNDLHWRFTEMPIFSSASSENWAFGGRGAKGEKEALGEEGRGKEERGGRKGLSEEENVS